MIICFKDKKYATLKTYFFMERRKFKILNDKYVNLKVEKEKLNRKLSEMDNQRAAYCAETPVDSDIFMHSTNSK